MATRRPIMKKARKRPVEAGVGRPSKQVSGSFLVDRAGSSLRSRAVASVRRAIFSLYYKPGERLTEKGLCELTGVSRSLMREALRDLQAEGLIQNLPHRSPVVVSLTREDAQEIYELRSALDPLAARLFVARASDEQVEELRTLVASCEEAMESHDVLRVIDTLERFYTAIFEGAGNRTAILLVRALHTKAGLLRALTFQQQTHSDTGRSITLIKRIFLAIKEREAGAAAEACIAQVERSRKVAMNVLKTTRRDTEARD
jgi:GntR family transcriptional regulator, trigonelline degradation regulator